MMSEALFLGFGLLLVVSSLMVILHRSPVTSALFLVLAFCSLAGIYLVLHAEFIGMIQIIVYAGAIMVLFLFVIMYMNLGRDVEGGAQVALRRMLGWLIGGLLVAEAAIVLGRRWAVGPESAETVRIGIGNTQALGQLLYTRYLFPFEITSIVLLVAMVGAVVIARGRPRPSGAPSGRGAATLPAPGPSAAPSAPMAETAETAPVASGRGAAGVGG